MSSRNNFYFPRNGRISTRFFRPILALAVIIFSAVSPLGGEAANDPLALFKAGKYSEAVEACQESLASNPSDIESYVTLCRGLIALGKYKEALLYGEKGHAIAKYDPRLIEICGEANFFLGKNEEALKGFQDFIVVSPEGTKVGPAYYFMGEIYIRLGKYQHADISFSTAVQYDVNDARTWARLGYAREQSGDLGYAKIAYTVALGINPRLSDALLGLERVERALNN